MKKYVLLLSLCVTALTVNAQTWSEVKAQKSVYLSGEGRGESIEEADERALADLISQISVAVEKQFTMTEEEVVSNKGAEASSYAQSKVKSYSSATLTNTERIIIQGEEEGEAIVGRYIKRSEIDKIFEGRRAKVLEYVGLALEAEENVALDNALRYYFWAQAMLKTLPNPNDVKYEGHLLSNWIPAQMDNILGGIKVSIIGKEGNDVDLFFSYKGKPVSSLDYTYFDGRNYSSIYSAKDGRGVLELLPGTTPETVKLKFEYQYKDQAKLYDKEVATAVGVVKGGVRRKATCNVDMSAETRGVTGSVSATGGTTQGVQGPAIPSATGEGTMVSGEMVQRVKIPNVGEVSEGQKTACKMVVNRVVSAIQSKNYQSVRSLFTDYGYDIFERLIHYGNARVLQQREYTYSKMGDQTVVRSVPMSFKFQNGAVKSFVEDVVFTINPDGKIDNISFGLGDVATADIMAHPKWSDDVKCMIVNFLEIYKTAFALKRLEYIESIFDDHAVIITGKVLMRKADSDADRYASNRYVQRTQYTKAEYMGHLRASFKSKEFINIRFAHTMVQKAQGRELYGIQLKQDYYSSNYGDSGYLYLQVDMTEPGQPIIKVRTWQDQIDPEVGRPYGMEDF